MQDLATEDMKDPTVIAEVNNPDGSDTLGTHSPIDIYIDPEKEKAALKKFDKWLLPVAFVFLVLSSLDRNNVSSTCTALVRFSLMSV